MQEDDLIETVNYRGFSFPIYLDDAGQSYYTIFDGKELGFGSYNVNYKDDLEFLVDSKLDTICWFEEFPGSKLEWFFNGYDFRDLRLTYRTRVIKVFLVADETKVNLEIIKSECLNILQKIAN